MRITVVAGLALALSACGSNGGDSAANEANALTADNMLMDENLMLDANVAANGATLDGNASVNSSTQNLMEKDLNTNDRDTNLANGL